MAVTTPNTTKAHAPDVTAFAAQDVIDNALILRASTVVAQVEGDAPAVRIPFVDADGDPGFVAEGAEIPSVDPEASEKLIHTGKTAHLITVSREQYLQNGISDLYAQAMRRAMVRKVDNAFVAQPAPGAGETTPPAGIANQNHTDGGTLDADLDVLVDSVTHIQSAYGEPSYMLFSPDAWSYTLKLKDATGSNRSLLDHRVDSAEQRVVGLPVLVNASIPAGSIYVVDSTAILSAVGDLQLAVSDQPAFSRDSYVMRATMRFGSVIANPDRVVSVTLPVDGS